jgi:glycosyltransferase involved in cell wall biosynthesis
MISEVRKDFSTPHETRTRDRVTGPQRWGKGERPAPGKHPRRRRDSKLRLGIITNCPGAWDANGHFRIPSSEGRLMNALIERFPEARVCIPVMDAVAPHFRQALDVEAANLDALPPLISTIKAQKYFFQVKKAVRKFAKTVDVLYVNIPFTIPRVLKGLDTPKLLHVVGDTSEVVRVSNDYRGLWRLAARAQARDMERTLQQLVAEPATRAATHGKELWNKLGCEQGRVVVSSCLKEHEMQPVENRRLGEVPRLLFVGYLRPEKGVTYLLEAFHQIRSKRPIKITLVGGADRTSRAQQDIHRMIDASPYRADIELAGVLPFGQPLFDAYRSHDVCVQPSLSEGTPRTLIEARAFGCPVVATRVGGIPQSVEDGRDGLLVEPCNSRQLAAAIERMLDDEPLRRRLIEAGIKKAKKRTLESFADELADELDLLGEEHILPARRTVAHTFPARFDSAPQIGVAVNF